MEKDFNSKIKKKHFLKLVTPVLVCAILVYLSFAIGYTQGQKNFVSKNQDKVVNTESGKPKDVSFSIFWETWNKLREKSVTETDAQKMIDGSISGMVSSLDDPYTMFMSKEENKRFREDISGEFGGIGVEIAPKDGVPTVVSALDGTPAQKAGIKTGDIVDEVDGTKTSTISFEETINKIRGQKGSEVKLKIVRAATADPIEYSVVRDTIVVKSVQWERKKEGSKDILYIKVRQFGDDTSKGFSDIAKEVAASKPDGIVVDLRNNPGGYLVTAVDLASYFIDGGVVVSEKGKNDKVKEYKTTTKARLKNYKLAVLVNKGSASASEIFAGAVQDRGSGKIFGEKTFGKGSVQELVELSDGSALKVTVAKWFTPKGRQINEQGISPDVEVSDQESTADDEQLIKALEYVRN
ncbi:MAG: S41 family peptidase [Patescibacteria group bacterium]